jgi:hypothetical protein
MQTLKVYSHLIFCFAFLNGYMINLISSRIIKKFFINSSCTVCGFPLKNDKLYNKSTAYGCWRLDFFVSDIKLILNYFICIKDFNAETITSLKLNLFSFFICSCQHQRKTICLYVYISDITLSRVFGVSILQLLIIYHIYDYDMLTLSQ